MRARVVEVLSRSTTPTGISWGCPLFIMEVKKKTVKMGKMIMQNR